MVEASSVSRSPRVSWSGLSRWRKLVLSVCVPLFFYKNNSPRAPSATESRTRRIRSGIENIVYLVLMAAQRVAAIATAMLNASRLMRKSFLVVAKRIEVLNI
jgi:hypothetical protein